MTVVAVFGCGGASGLNTVQGARIAGAGTIVAVDTNSCQAHRTGADSVPPTPSMPVRSIPLDVLRELSGGRGVDVAFEVVGQARDGRAGHGGDPAWRPDRAGRGGARSRDDPLERCSGSSARPSSCERCYYGSANVRDDVPRLLSLWRSGDLLLEELVSEVISLGQIEQAFAAIMAGTATRSVIRYEA